MSTMIETKFGDAYLQSTGYYIVTQGKYTGKYLHRLVFEDFYQINIDEEFDEPMVIHHIDGDKTNNEIWNLDIMTNSEHAKYHLTGRRRTDESKIKQSKTKNTTGYLNVSKCKKQNCKQGFSYVYTYYEKDQRKYIQNKDLDELEEKVVARGLPWYKFEDELKDELTGGEIK